MIGIRVKVQRERTQGFHISGNLNRAFKLNPLEAIAAGIIFLCGLHVGVDMDDLGNPRSVRTVGNLNHHPVIAGGEFYPALR